VFVDATSFNLPLFTVKVMPKNRTDRNKSSFEKPSSSKDSLDPHSASSNNLEVYKKLLERDAELDRELLKFSDLSNKQSDLKTVMDQLHRYNDVKDATQIILGSLANLEGSTVGELHERYGLTSNDS